MSSEAVQIDKYNEAWDAFLDSYRDVKAQKEILLRFAVRVIEVVEEALPDLAEQFKDDFQRICNGEDFSDIESRDESESGQ